MTGAVGAKCTSAVAANVAGARGIAATRNVLARQIWHRLSSWAGGHFAPPGASTCGAVGAWTPGSRAGQTASVQTWISSIPMLLARRINGGRENTDRV
jgi:hypothetical protein